MDWSGNKVLKALKFDVPTFLMQVASSRMTKAGCRGVTRASNSVRKMATLTMITGCCVALISLRIWRRWTGVPRYKKGIQCCFGRTPVGSGSRVKPSSVLAQFSIRIGGTTMTILLTRPISNRPRAIIRLVNVLPSPGSLNRPVRRRCTRDSKSSIWSGRGLRGRS